MNAPKLTVAQLAEQQNAMMQAMQLMMQTVAAQAAAPAVAAAPATPGEILATSPQVAAGVQAKHGKMKAEAETMVSDVISLFEGFGFDGVNLVFAVNSLANNGQFTYFQGRQAIERIAAKEAMPSRFNETEDYSDRRAEAVRKADAGLRMFYAANKAVDLLFQQIKATDERAADMLDEYLKPIDVSEAAVQKALQKKDDDWAKRRNAQGANARAAATAEYGATA